MVRPTAESKPTVAVLSRVLVAGSRSAWPTDSDRNAAAVPRVRNASDTWSWLGPLSPTSSW